MPACARSEIFDPDVVGTYHCFSRCVRRGHLCGVDEYTGKDYSHRLDWFDVRVRQMAAVFMVDLLSYSFLNNHFHSMLRNRPDLVAKLSDRQVARRSLLLSPNKMPEGHRLKEPTAKQIKAVLSDRKKIEQWRKRLSSISWYMRYLKEPIARRANAEDEVTGHFWEQRFSSVRLLDVTAIILCSVYVDLNEVRAGIAATPEQSNNSSIGKRIVAWCAEGKQKSQPSDKQARQRARGSQKEASPEWLAPVHENSDNGTRSGTLTEERPISDSPRPSNSGYLPMTVEQYIELVDWTGRAVRDDKRGSIPERLAPIMSRLVGNLDAFVHVAQNFGTLFKRFCGMPPVLQKHAQDRGVTRAHGISVARQLAAQDR